MSHVIRWASDYQRWNCFDTEGFFFCSPVSGDGNLAREQALTRLILHMKDKGVNFKRISPDELVEAAKGKNVPVSDRTDLEHGDANLSVNWGDEE